MESLSSIQKEKNEFIKEYNDILGVKEISKLFGISAKTVYKFLKNENIDYIMVGRKICVPKVNIINFIFKETIWNHF